MRPQPTAPQPRGVGLARLLAAVAVGAALVATAAAELPPAEEVMQQVNERYRGDDSEMRLRLVFRDEKQGEHTRQVAVRRKRFATGHRTVFHVTAPEHLAGIRLLLSEDDDQRGMWMYFPRGDHLVPVVSRGLSALASDFSCEDLKVAFRLEDYHFANLGREEISGGTALKIEMRPRSERLAKELGYSRVVGWVLEDLWILQRAEYFSWDQERPFKTFEAEPPEEVDGVWTVRRYRMVNHRARHSTDAEVEEVRYRLELPPGEFAAEALRP